MGNSQFYSPIKSSVDTIQTCTSQIQTSVNQLQQTDVANLNTKVTNLGWWGKYSKQIITYPMTLTRTNVVSVTGKSGLFSLAFDINSAGFPYLKIVVDGVTIEDYTGNKFSMQANASYRYGVPSLPSAGGINDALPGQTVTRKIYPFSIAATISDMLDNFSYFPFNNSLSIDIGMSIQSAWNLAVVGVYSA